mgnify:CR=1 FL=1
MRESTRFTLWAAVSAVALVGSAVPAFAQSAPEVRPQDIIVTARKRAESLQDAPVAISVVSAQKLNENALTSLTDVASIAGGGVMIAQAGVTTTLSIRGVSSDSTNIGRYKALLSDVSGRWAWNQQIYGHVFYPFTDTIGNLTFEQTSDDLGDITVTCELVQLVQ